MPVAASTVTEAVSRTPEQNVRSFECTQCCRGVRIRGALCVPPDATNLSFSTNAPTHRELEALDWQSCMPKQSVYNLLYFSWQSPPPFYP